MLGGTICFSADSTRRYLSLACKPSLALFGAYTLETVQDFLIKSDIKPLMHLLEISVFSLNIVILRLIKIMNRADKNWAHF